MPLPLPTFCDCFSCGRTLRGISGVSLPKYVSEKADCLMSVAGWVPTREFPGFRSHERPVCYWCLPWAMGRWEVRLRVKAPAPSFSPFEDKPDGHEERIAAHHERIAGIEQGRAIEAAA